MTGGGSPAGGMGGIGGSPAGGMTGGGSPAGGMTGGGSPAGGMGGIGGSPAATVPFKELVQDAAERCTSHMVCDSHGTDSRGRSNKYCDKFGSCYHCGWARRNYCDAHNSDCSRCGGKFRT